MIQLRGSGNACTVFARCVGHIDGHADPQAVPDRGNEHVVVHGHLATWNSFWGCQEGIRGAPRGGTGSPPRPRQTQRCPACCSVPPDATPACMWLIISFLATVASSSVCIVDVDPLQVQFLAHARVRLQPDTAQSVFGVPQLSQNAAAPAAGDPTMLTSSREATSGAAGESAVAVSALSSTGGASGQAGAAQAGRLVTPRTAVLRLDRELALRSAR